jgi:hypothetical protein
LSYQVAIKDIFGCSIDCEHLNVLGTCGMAQKRLAVGQKLRNLEWRVDASALFKSTCTLEQTSEPHRHSIVGCYIGYRHREIGVYGCGTTLDSRAMIVDVVDACIGLARVQGETLSIRPISPLRR